MESSKSNHDIKQFLNAPIITVGKYKGTALDKVPNSYLRWMLSQDFPKEWVEFAKKKVDESEYFPDHISLSRHAIDMFSKRFIVHWNSHVRMHGDKADGIATYIAKMALRAWNEGIDTSKNRTADDGKCRDYNGIRFVFKVSPHFPDYKDVITIMSGTD